LIPKRQLRFRYLLIAFCGWLGMALQAEAQLPIVKGLSRTQSGMLYYDANAAQDKKERIYSYTICPDSAACIHLDFNLVASEQGKLAAPQDFIRVFDGNDNQAPLLGTLGAASGSLMLQSRSNCITMEFQRDMTGQNSTWTALWKAKSKAECIRPLEQGPCAALQDICGPEYHENFHYFGPKATAAIERPVGTCVEKEHNSTWYRFVAAKTGPIVFNIVPDNSIDDFDWVLIKGDPENPAQCPDLNLEAQRLACNYAGGRGPKGATGMDQRGDALTASSADNPYCKSISAKQGDVFFLLIDDYSKHSTGFTIRFNDVVMACENPKKDLLQIAWNENLNIAPVDPRSTFSKSTRVLRIDLEEKANLSLMASLHPDGLYDLPANKVGKVLTAKPQFNWTRGLVPALLNGLKVGRLQAYSASDFQSPVWFGDLVDMAYRQRDTVAHPQKWSWWAPETTTMEYFTNVVELIVDETFDKNSGMNRQRIRYIRILWTDREGNSPDYNVAVFKYEDVSDLLDHIPVENQHNEVQSLSMKDFLEGQMYQSIPIVSGNQKAKTLNQARFLGDKQLECDNFIWDR
jgi:hypothetical protein